MKWVLLLHSNREKAGELTAIKHDHLSGPLVEYASKLHAEWMEDRKAGLRSGGGQILLALTSDVHVRKDGTLELEWANAQCLFDDMLPYVDWCDAHGLSIDGADGEASFH